MPTTVHVAVADEGRSGRGGSIESKLLSDPDSKGGRLRREKERDGDL